MQYVIIHLTPCNILVIMKKVYLPANKIFYSFSIKNINIVSIVTVLYNCKLKIIKSIKLLWYGLFDMKV